MEELKEVKKRGPRKGVKYPDISASAKGRKGNGGNSRPTEYKIEYNEQALNLCLLGLTDEKIAEFFGVCVQTLYNWKEVYPLFFDAMTEGKVLSNGKVARSLYEKCFDREVEVEKAFVYKGSEVIVKVKEQREADTGAIKMFLSNRERKLWGNTDKDEETKINITVSGPLLKLND